MYQQFTRQPDQRQHAGTQGTQAVAAAVLTTLTERDRKILEKGIETAERESYRLWEQGYHQSLHLPGGRECAPGVICVLRPSASVQQGGHRFYLVSLSPLSPERCLSPDPAHWRYTCDCPFYQRTERALGTGCACCKHGMWVLRHFLSSLARKRVVDHVLAAVPPAPAPTQTVEQTRRVFDRSAQDQVLEQRRNSFATALHKPVDLAALPSGPTVYPALAPSRGSLPALPDRKPVSTATRKADFD